MNKPLYLSTDFILIMNEYLNFYKEKQEKLSKERKIAQDKMNRLNLEFEKSLEKENLKLELEQALEESCRIDKEYNICNEKIRNLVLFNANLVLDKYNKNDSFFEEILKHFENLEKYEICSKLKNIYKEYLIEQ